VKDRVQGLARTGAFRKGGSPKSGGGGGGGSGGGGGQANSGNGQRGTKKKGTALVEVEEEEEADDAASADVEDEQFPSYQELLRTNGYIGSNIGVEANNVWDGDGVSHFGFIQVGSPDGGQDQGVCFADVPAWTYQGIGGSKPKKKTVSKKPSAIVKVPSPQNTKPAFIKSILKSAGRLNRSASRGDKGVKFGGSSTKAGRDVCEHVAVQKTQAQIINVSSVLASYGPRISSQVSPQEW
jgi:hypothetical protein